MPARRRQLAAAVEAIAARHVDTTSTLAESDDLRAGIWPLVWEPLARSGLLGTALPGRHGGSGGTVEDAAAVIEEAGYHLVPGALLASCLAGLVVRRHGSVAAAEEILPALVRGGTAACAVDPGSLRAVPDDLGLEVTGRSAPVEGALSAQYIVLAAESGTGAESFVVDTGAPGVQVVAAPSADGTRDRGVVVLRAHRVLQRDRLGDCLDDTRQLAARMFLADAVGVLRWFAARAQGGAEWNLAVHRAVRARGVTVNPAGLQALGDVADVVAGALSLLSSDASTGVHADAALRRARLCGLAELLSRPHSNPH